MVTPRQSWYREIYLTSDHWKRLRLVKLQSVEARCWRCGCQNWSNHVHHLTYENLWRERLEDLRVLCPGCHDREHVRCTFAALNR